MNSDDEKLNQMLNSVQPKAASADLADRIIAARTASFADQEESTTIFSLIADSLMLFKPAPVMACLLLAGVLSGWYIENDSGQAILPTSLEAGMAVEDELFDFIDYEVSML